jgi:flagellar protein FlaF
MYIDVYKKASIASESPRAIEYKIFAEITGELIAANSEDKITPQRVNALFRNSQLWLTLESDLALPTNKLDKELKAGLISLAIWVRKFTTQAMRTREDLEPAITVNKQIMEGLLMAEKNSKQRPQLSAPADMAQLSI